MIDDKIRQKKFKEQTELIVLIEMDHPGSRHNMTGRLSTLWPMVF